MHFDLTDPALYSNDDERSATFPVLAANFMDVFQIHFSVFYRPASRAAVQQHLVSASFTIDNSL